MTEFPLLETEERGGEGKESSKGEVEGNGSGIVG
jgi:hypothetical protein